MHSYRIHDHPRNSMLFTINPWKIHLLFAQYPWKFHILDPLFIFFSGILSEKKDFRHKFSFFNPLNGQDLLSVTKVFSQCSLSKEHYYCYKTHTSLMESTVLSHIWITLPFLQENLDPPSMIFQKSPPHHYHHPINKGRGFALS